MKKIFAANWKLHKNPSETRAFFQAWKEKSAHIGHEGARHGSHEGARHANSEVWFFPPAVSFEAASGALAGSEIKFGLQNIYSELKGAFTGENSAQVVKDLGGHGALVGHSERRSLFGENHALLAKKVKALQDLNLLPMFCIGETLTERQSGKTQSVVQEQLRLGLESADRTKPVILAYEPVWAIGTGVVATSEQVREVHAWVREELNTLGFTTTPILYGGSVKADNAKELIMIKNVDGFLVGGASLEVDSFLKISQCLD
jgi:triosephosphate isomerase